MAPSSTENVTSIINPERKIKLKPFLEIGRAGIKRFDGHLRHEFLEVLRGLNGIRTFREMRDNDSIIGAGMGATEQVLGKASWFIQAGKAKDKGSKSKKASPLAKEAAEHVVSCMDDMSHTWEDVITDASTCMTYGWAWLEVVYKYRKGQDTNIPRFKSKYSDGLVGWRKMVLRHQSSFHEWIISEDDEIVGLTQLIPNSYDFKDIPMNKSLLFRTRVEANNPEGRSLLRNAYRSWYFKKLMEELEAIGVERDLVGLPVITGPEDFDIEDPENEALASEINALIYALRRDEQEGIFLPFGFELHLLGEGSGVKRQFDVDRIINRYDKRIASVLLAQFIMLGMDRVGSFALSKNQNALFLTAVQGYLSKFASVLNRFEIPRLMYLNPKFRPLIERDELPQFIPGKVTESDLEALSLFIDRLAKHGFLVPDEELSEDLLRVAGFEEPHVRRTEVLQERAPVKLPKPQPLVAMNPNNAPGVASANPPQAAAKPNAKNGKPKDPVKVAASSSPLSSSPPPGGKE